MTIIQYYPGQLRVKVLVFVSILK